MPECLGVCQTFRHLSQLARYDASMSQALDFIAPRADFNSQLADELARQAVAMPADNSDSAQEWRSPFKDYHRILTPEGGILILYMDQDRSVFIEILRAFAWTVATGLGGWLLFFESALNGLLCLVTFALVMFLAYRIVHRPMEVSHSVEIRADALIVDGTDVFYAEDIGDHWPELQMKDDDTDRMVICGICGSRFIEYMTANRRDENDRTPEILAADLDAAFEQLWGRREVTFTTAL
jgi:hypothetical protein